VIEQTLQTWEEFELEWRKLEEERARKLRETDAYISDYLYRGQADSRWKLETTLERTVVEKVNLVEYFRLLSIAKSKVEVFTEKNWDIPTYDDYGDWLDNSRWLMQYGFKAYDFFVYMRHHGFPSPLLDWSESPYVAAFFAMNHPPKDAEYASIYAFCEHSGLGKGGWAEEPSITGLGPLVRAHKRHFLQQSQYTVCTAKTGRKTHYASHEDVTAKNNPDQDLLWKFNLPVSERPKVLAALNKMNLNAFSLFGTEDSLMDAIAVREIVLRKHPFN
jgi:hypothetical protein